MDIRKFLEKPPVEITILFITLFIFIVSDRLIPEKGEWSFVPPILGALVVAEMLIIVGMEVKENAKRHGWKHEVLDTLVAIIIALGIWLGASYFLNTSSPVSAVVSCSMLSNLERGDFVIVHGVEPSGYEISMSRKEFQSFSDDHSMVSSPEGDLKVPGSLYSFCLVKSNDEMCRDFVHRPSEYVETNGPFVYHYASCTIFYDNGTSFNAPCTESIEFKGKNYLTNFSNDVIVYQPQSKDIYSALGDIVHRVFFKITVDNETYYVTRGDNNPILDIQFYDYNYQRKNNPIPEQNVKGRVIGRIPILGYFKLLVAGFWNEDSQCKWKISYDRIENSS